MKNALKTKGRPNQSRRHEGALVGLDPQTKLQAPRRVARGAIAPPPIPKVALAIFMLIKLLMCKPKKCVGANQRNCQKKIFYFNS